MDGLAIGELAKKTGVHLETIRYYERIGLVCPPPRTRAGHRVFNQEDVARLRLIRHSRELGFGLSAIRQLLQLSERKTGACREAYAVAAAHVEAIDEKLFALAQMRESLLILMRSCQPASTGEQRCPLLEAMRSPDCCGPGAA